MNKILILGALLLASPFQAQAADSAAKTGVAEKSAAEASGAVQVPGFDLPASIFMSEQARKGLVEQLEETRFIKDLPKNDIKKLRESINARVMPDLKRVRDRYAVEMKDQVFAGVHALVVTPQGGVDAARREQVLINVHGGGFVIGDTAVVGSLESIPVAALGKIKVVTIDYRLGPEHKFPAASEDVAAVYKELLKTYQPQNVGLYGCSAGGLLTAQATAWIQKQGLPRMGAIGIFCASAAGWMVGDSSYVVPAVMGSGVRQRDKYKGGSAVGNAEYFSEANFDDPLVAPLRSSAVLSKFPPTLIISSTRDFALSGAVNTHAQLVKLGVEAELHIWDGVWHGFLTDSELPESHEAYDVIVKFFQKNLGKS